MCTIVTVLPYHWQDLVKYFFEAPLSTRHPHTYARPVTPSVAREVTPKSACSVSRIVLFY